MRQGWIKDTLKVNTIISMVVYIMMLGQLLFVRMALNVGIRMENAIETTVQLLNGATEKRVVV